MPQENFYAVGPHEGKSVVLDRYVFKDGVFTFEGSKDDIAIITRTMADRYQAFPKDQFEGAKRAFEEAQAKLVLDGGSEVREAHQKLVTVARRLIAEQVDPVSLYGEGEAAERMRQVMEELKADEVDGDSRLTDAELEADRQAKAKAAEQAELDRKAAEQAEIDRKAAEQAEIDRAKAAEAPRTLADVIKSLDPDNDDCWTSRGVPSIDAIIARYGSPVTRAEVEAAVPDFNRTQARAAKVAG